MGALCIVAFAVTALTSVPLFVSYLMGSTPGNRLVVDLHVWLGAVFIIIGSIRMIKNKTFMNMEGKK